jgi:hypothetical protein
VRKRTQRTSFARPCRLTERGAGRAGRAFTLTAVIALKGWDRFQHYKDRDPPWVKLYRDVLTSESWVIGTDLSRLVQLASVLLAARYGNRIPYRWDLIRKVTHLDCTEKAFNEAVRHLSEHGFLEVQQVSDDTKPVVQSASTPLATCSSEERRGEKSREEGEQSIKLVEQKLDDGPVNRVFEHWRSEFRHPKAALDSKRQRVIQQALKHYDEPTLCQAISGYKLSPHHMGQNAQSTVYDDISLFLRDSEHIERGLNFARAPPVAAKSAVEIARENLRKSVNGSARVVSEQSRESGEGGMGSLVRVLR